MVGFDNQAGGRSPGSGFEQESYMALLDNFFEKTLSKTNDRSSMTRHLSF